MKHFVVVLDWASEYECGSNVIGVTHSLEDAKKIFNETAAEEREYAIEHEWIIYDDVDTVFEAGQDGYYISNHTNLYIQEVN
jgi:hypothetical protein